MENYSNAVRPIERRVFLLSSSSGQRFCLTTSPTSAPLGTLLFIHPFAEELNKTRRMTAIAARAFARAGWLTLQMDLFGCGDSTGEFGDTGWRDWLADVSLGHDWLQENYPAAPIAFWTLRAGSLLAADWLAEHRADLPLILWQPVANGRQHLRQFLRLKAAAEILDGQSGADLADLSEVLETGRSVEVAGYEISAGLATGLDEAELRLPSGYKAPVVIFEVRSGGEGVVSPAMGALARRLEETADSVTVEPVRGPGFWQTVEIETAPMLIEATLEYLGSILK